MSLWDGDFWTIWRNRCAPRPDRKSTRLNSSHSQISYAVFCLKKKKTKLNHFLLCCRSLIFYDVVSAFRPTNTTHSMMDNSLSRSRNSLSARVLVPLQTESVLA